MSQAVNENLSEVVFAWTNVFLHSARPHEKTERRPSERLAQFEAERVRPACPVTAQHACPCAPEDEFMWAVN
ncbi:MAG: hypothetical protein ACXWP0_12090 [Ktedonobacterales bacterium]